MVEKSDVEKAVQMSIDQLESDLNRVKKLLNLESMEQQEQMEGAKIRRRGYTSPKREPSDGSPHSRRHHTTLAVISLEATPVNTEDEEGERSPASVRRRSSGNRPPVSSRTYLRPTIYQGTSAASPTLVSSSNPGSSYKNLKSNEAPGDEEYCCFWPFTLLGKKPILRLFLVMFINGLLSMMCSALIIEMEGPAQRERQRVKNEMNETAQEVKRNLTDMILKMNTSEYNMSEAINLLDDFSRILPNVSKKDEIPWEMLSAQAFITSVQTTTGYGDIIPVTFWGKFFTLIYALIGIPVFMWYIVKLGTLFRLVAMKALYGTMLCICPAPMTKPPPPPSTPNFEPLPADGRRSTLTQLRLVDLNTRLKQQYYDDKRFHPSVIGCILLIFLCSVSLFISHMEGISYFDSFYASFITYSTIGFGDIDIFKISYRSNWFNLLIYGNFIHIAGYMILSAWVAAILEKCGVRKF